MAEDYLEAQRREVMHRRLYDRVMEALQTHDPLGVATASRIFATCSAGDHIVAPRAMYAESARLFREP